MAMSFIKLLRQSSFSGRLGLCMVAICLAAAVLAPVISPYGETEVAGDVWVEAGTEFFLGTDHLGRDIFTRLMYGARNTIAIALATTRSPF
jgi:peptide/nickel transport system permease protein